MAAHEERLTQDQLRSRTGVDVESGYPARSYAWLVVAILIGTAILSYTDRQVLSLLVDPIRHDLGLSDFQISLLLGTAFALIYGVAGVPFGWLADRTSRRNLIFAGVVFWSIGTVGCAYAHSFAELFAARVIVGLGESVLSPSAISLISDYFPPSRRGLAVGSFLSGIAIGSGAAILIGGGALHLVQAGALVGTPFAALTPWRLVLLVLGAPGFAWSLVILLVREPLRRVVVARDSSSGSERAALRRQALRTVAPIYVVVAMASFVDNAVGAWAPTELIRTFHRDAADVGVELGILITIGFGGGVLLGGWLADTVGSGGRWLRKLGICLVAGSCVVAAAWAIDAHSAGIVMGAVALYFALSGIVTACGFSAILDIVPSGQRAFAMAVSFFLNVAVGAGLGPTAVTLVSDHVFGAAAGYGPAIALTAAGGFVIVALTALATLVASRPRPVPAAAA